MFSSQFNSSRDIRVYAQKFDSKGSYTFELLPFVNVLDLRPDTNILLAHHPLENGKSVTDSRVVLPARLSLTIAILSGEVPEGQLAYANALTNASYSETMLFSISMMFGEVRNLVVSRSSRTESAKVHNAIVQSVSFEECFFPENGEPTPKSAEDGSTVECPCVYT